MTDAEAKIAELEARLDALVRTQINFQTEVVRIRSELAGLRGGPRAEQPKPELPYQPPKSQYTPEPPTSPPRPDESQGAYQTVPPPTFGMRPEHARPRPNPASEGAFSRYASSTAESARADLEKFIGENLISKIGIIVLVLGVGIGSKYAIDNNLISPLARIIVGYLFGFGLIGLAVKLKPKYLNFSAVLISGGMAIMYFLTYFAYASYSLMPRSAAFLLMVMFTLFSVASALLYNRQVIAHIGLVGAYAVPFLLSNESGNYLILFVYMAMINTGILAISVKKYWNPLFYTSSGFTWLIFLGWFAGKYSPAEHFYIALIFLAVFFAIFYATKIVHGVLYPERDKRQNFVSIIVTGVIFYSFCLAISFARAEDREYTAFFLYLAAAGLAILITSYRFYGRYLVYLSYPFTWLIFGGWLLTKYRAEEHLILAAIFAGVFFAVFYGATIVYRLLSESGQLTENSGLLLTNSFIFYGVGYGILDSRESLHGYAGIFTAAHAAMHFAVAQVVTRLKSSAVDIVQVLTVLVLTFASITIPIQFDGNYVTLAWSAEAALLFWFGRAKQIPLFEYFSYPVMALAAGSLMADWVTASSDRTFYVSEFNRQPIANGDFITVLVFVAAFAFIYLTNRDKQHAPAIDVDLVRPLGYMMAAIGLFALYNTFRLEIDNYHHIIGLTDTPEALDEYTTGFRREIGRFNVIWQMNYTVLFLTAMWFVNVRKVRSAILAVAGIAFSLIVLFVFATIGMYLFHELRQSYMLRESGGQLNIAIRYISYAFEAGIFYSLYSYSRSGLLDERLEKHSRMLVFEAVLSVFVLIAASGELINLMAQFSLPDGYKLGLSVLWGLYALVLIVFGIARNKKHLRIGAFVLLGVTLAKLFLYDIADLDTIPKTILFVSLGILLLVVSFLYNKYKSVIFEAAAAGEEKPPHEA